MAFPRNCQPRPCGQHAVSKKDSGCTGESGRGQITGHWSFVLHGMDPLEGFKRRDRLLFECLKTALLLCGK